MIPTTELRRRLGGLFMAANLQKHTRTTQAYITAPSEIVAAYQCLTFSPQQYLFSIHSTQ